MNNKTIILQGSSRNKGNTFRINALIQQSTHWDIIDLKEYQIGHFDYDFKNTNDDFLPLIRKIIAEYDTIIFTTPVYWYTMSGILKVFFDRISDLLKIEKETGRQLRGKNMAMISCSGDDDLVSGFSIPFVETANYLGMNYLGDIHIAIEDDEVISDAMKIRILNFLKVIKKG